MKKNEMQFYMLLRDFLGDYLIQKRNFSDKTARAYRQSLKLLRKYFKEEKGIGFEKIRFALFTRENIYDFLMWLKKAKKNSASTLNLRLTAIKSFLKYCSEEDMELTSYYLDISSIHAFKASKKVCVKFLSQEQLKLLFSISDISTRIGRRDRFFMILTYEIGGRLQEILDLTLNCIIRDGSRVKIILHGKGDKTRSVPLLGQTVHHLDAYLKEFHKQGTRADYLFYTIHDSKHTKMKQGTVDYFLKKYGSLAKEKNENFPEGLHTHMLRHSIAMAMYKKGIPISYIRDFLGHSSIETTTVYSYADEETITKALESVNDTVNSLPMPKKGWKGHEQYLIALCGLD